MLAGKEGGGSGVEYSCQANLLRAVSTHFRETKSLWNGQPGKLKTGFIFFLLFHFSRSTAILSENEKRGRS